VDIEESEDKPVSLRACRGHGLCSGQSYVLLLGGYEQIPCIIIMIGVAKPRRIRWTEHVLPTGKKSYVCMVLLRQHKVTNHLEDKDLDGEL
jgi:hypothetical protein